MILRKGEIINFNGLIYKCLVEETEIPRIITKQILDELCYVGTFKDLN